MLALSLSGKEYIIAGKVTLIPKGWTLNDYRYVMKDAQFYRSFLVSIVRTLLAVAVEMTLTICAAYPLSISRHRFRQRPLYAWFFIVTIIFNGGMIPRPTWSSARPGCWTPSGRLCCPTRFRSLTSCCCPTTSRRCPKP